MAHIELCPHLRAPPSSGRALPVGNCLSFNAIMEELGISLKHQKKLKKRSRTKGKSSFPSILTCQQRRTLRKETMA
ncbi:hypothetical protein EK904_000509 [Melospiza melodia maxima]|nr:hypothetical protein EK904_000509 [Melospiza melodia maxima]